MDTLEEVELLDLAQVRLAVLLDVVDADDSTLDALLRRLFDPDEQADAPISAFNSSL